MTTNKTMFKQINIVKQICISKTWCHRGDSNKYLIFLVLGHLLSIGVDKANKEEMLKTRI